MKNTIPSKLLVQQIFDLGIARKPLFGISERNAIAENEKFSDKIRKILKFSNVKKMEKQDRPEVAFIGRSNVGKSRLLNALLNCSGLCKVSSKPGETTQLQMIKMDRMNFIDMPGYGFAHGKPDVVYDFPNLVLIA